VRGVSGRMAADLQASGFAGALDCSSESAELRAETPRGSGLAPALAGLGAENAAMAKLLRVIATVLAIVAGPVLASLIERHLPPPAQYASRLHLRGSIAFNSDLRLRGSIR
jgi:hypothetical protein